MQDDKIHHISMPEDNSKINQISIIMQLNIIIDLKGLSD